MDEPRLLAAHERPDGLDDLRRPPTRLWTRGALPASPSVAIVGTRRADAASCRFARALASDLARAGFAIVSGGADGVDEAAHEGALDADGRTLVVLPTPLTRPYPPRSRPLFERVLASGGGWLSERAPDEPSHKAHFLMRNRLIAAIADATVVVQAPHKSGALSTARWADKLERPLFAVPASPWDRRAAGNVALLRRGARVCTGAADVAEALGRRVPRRPPRARTPAALLDPPQRAVLEALGPQPSPVHAIVDATGLGVVAVRVALVQLAARDLADQRPEGWLAVA